MICECEWDDTRKCASIVCMLSVTDLCGSDDTVVPCVPAVYVRTIALSSVISVGRAVRRARGPPGRQGHQCKRASSVARKHLRFRSGFYRPRDRLGMES